MMGSTISYLFSPLSGLWSSIERHSQILGPSRAAAELARQGFHEESKKCMMELKKLKDS